MKLTRLELSGFKSFADTVALTFDDGITAVVGPNGCGKSNVSDAVRWVLGEQRARILRGAKMEDIIFQGTTKRKPVNVASISLHFDNSDGVLPVSYREVVITRRLSRNGQSDYLMNQQPVRLKDVQDLLRGTGLASDGGVVIEAQQIDRLLSDRTDERRALFEEAAGIGLYRDRKTTTERRLDKTLEDLQRLDDVISEVQTQVRSLSRQRGKADRHQTLTADRFAIVMTLARRSLKKLDERVKETAQRKKEIDELLPEARKKIGELEQERENRVQKRASTEAQRAGLLRQLAERQEEAGKLEGDLTVATERLTNASSRVTRARDEMAHAERQKEQAKREKDAAQEELTQAAEARASVQTELDLRAAGEKETKDRLENQRTTCRTLENELQETAERHRSLSGEREALQRDVGDLTGQERELKERSETAEKNLEQATTKLADAERVLEDKRQANQQATSELEKARHTLAAAKENEAAVIAERRAVQERLLQTEARKEALEALERDRAGLAPAAKELLENQDQFDDGAVLGPLSDFLRPTAAGAESVEQVLSDWIHAVLVRDENAVEAVRKWHAEANPGPLVLLPIQPGPVTSGSLDDAFRLEVERPAKQWADALLAGHVSLGDGDA
ncbi:MAG: AAA family ATPase, partial [Gemmatimonadota bacterium]|nr:AAA family ATPase [Gemmatimonadota bacterium]